MRNPRKSGFAFSKLCNCCEVFTMNNFQQQTGLLLAERIKFKLATLTYHCVHCAALRYLSAQLTRVADIHSPWRLRSSATDAIPVRYK